MIWQLPEVQIVRGGNEGVDEGEAGHAQRLVVPDEEALNDRLESIPALNLASNCDRLQGLEQKGKDFDSVNTFTKIFNPLTKMVKLLAYKKNIYSSVSYSKYIYQSLKGQSRSENCLEDIHNWNT